MVRANKTPPTTARPKRTNKRQLPQKLLVSNTPDTEILPGRYACIPTRGVLRLATLINRNRQFPLVHVEEAHLRLTRTLQTLLPLHPLNYRMLPPAKCTPTNLPSPNIPVRPPRQALPLQWPHPTTLRFLRETEWPLGTRVKPCPMTPFMTTMVLLVKTLWTQLSCRR